MKSTPKGATTKPADRRYGDGRAAFIGRLEAIQAWVDEGRTLRSFYDAQDAALGITYSQFVRHARKLLRPSKGIPDTRSATNARNPPAPGPATTVRPAGTPQAAPRPGVPQFQHAATKPEHDDLV